MFSVPGLNIKGIGFMFAWEWCWILGSMEEVRWAWLGKGVERVGKAWVGGRVSDVMENDVCKEGGGGGGREGWMWRCEGWFDDWDWFKGTMVFIRGGGYVFLLITPGVLSMDNESSTVLAEDVIVVIVVVATGNVKVPKTLDSGVEFAFACGFITIRLREPVVLITEEPGLTNWRDSWGVWDAWGGWGDEGGWQGWRSWGGSETNELIAIDDAGVSIMRKSYIS